MPLRYITILFSLICLAGYQQCQGKTRPEVDEQKDNGHLDASVQRHFASVGGYQKGDLITHSQVEELQAFLRKTQGHSAATHPRVLRRFLLDDTRFAQLFYKKNGANILRMAAAQNHGYKVFDRISRSAAGYARLVEAVDHADLETLNQLAQKELQKQPSVKEKNNDPPIRTKPTRLYTVEEYLAAIQPATQNEELADQTKVSEQ